MQRIAESELILNDRGAIYHLDLLPEELATTIIIVGDPFRVKEVSKYFDHIEVMGHHRDFLFQVVKLFPAVHKSRGKLQ